MASAGRTVTPGPGAARCARWLWTLGLGGATIAAVGPTATAEAERQVRALLRQRHRLGPNQADDFSVRNMAEVAETLEATSRVWTMRLGVSPECRCWSAGSAS